VVQHKKRESRIGFGWQTNFSFVSIGQAQRARPVKSQIEEQIDDLTNKKRILQIVAKGFYRESQYRNSRFPEGL